MADRQDSALDASHRLVARRYRLETSIGQGAMGTVWSGTDELLHRSVAVKEMKLAPDLPEDEAAELRERALREARAMAVVTHPNVVMLYDVAWDGDSPFVVMELVAGQSLGKILDRHGRLDVPLLALVVDGVAAALQAAHRLDIVHRDVKPGNVLVGKHGEIKLSDFGIARNSADPTLTRTGYVLGTPAFLAPEIAVGDGVTPSADLWSLGTMLFRAAEGRLPYDHSDPLIILSMIINGKVPQHHQTGPIGEVISGLMVKDPAQRMPLEEVRRRVHPLLPEAGTSPFSRLLDPNAPAMRNGTDSATRELSRGVPQPEHAPTSPPTTPLAGKVTPRRWRVIISVVVVAVLGVAVFLILNNKEQDPEQGKAPVRGVPPDSFDAYSIIQAEDYSRAVPGENVPVYTPENVPEGMDSSPILESMPWFYTLTYQKVDFGPASALSFRAQVRSVRGHDPNWMIEIRVDDPKSTPIGKLPVGDTAGTWTQVIRPVTRVVGTHDLYLTFVPEDGKGYSVLVPADYVSLDWFRFEW